MIENFRDIVDNGVQIQHLADQLLLYIRTKGSSPLEKLSAKFKADHAAIQAALQEIEGWGYKFKKSAKGIITFVEAPEVLTATEISYKLKTRTIGRAIHAYRTVKSTNDLAAQMADHGAPEGTIVTSEHQSQGRGRLGRTWYSPEGAGVYVSIILRPKISPEKAPGLSIMTAIALADTLSDYCPGDVQIKWPNDVLLSGRKVAGILTELSAERNKINYVIVGVGINANQRTSDFPDDIRRTATSLRIVTKKRIHRVELLQQFLVAFEKEYFPYQKTGLKKVQRRLHKYLAMLGHQIRLASGAHVIEGVAVDVDSSGALILDDNGKRQSISAGEVSVVKQ